MSDGHVANQDVLEEIELQCQCGSHLLVLAQKSSRLMMSDSFEVSPAPLTMVMLLFLPRGFAVLSES